MSISAVINELKEKNIIILNSEDLEMLLAEAELIIEKDTLISGQIRILKFESSYMSQESTPKGEIVLRIFNSLQEAEELVNEHLDIYDKMWDGCGCKINYYS